MSSGIRGSARSAAIGCLLLSVLAVPGQVRASSSASSRARADWPQFGYSPSHASFNPRESILDPGNVGALTQKWLTPTGGGNGIQPMTGVTVADGVAYVGSFDKDLHAFDARTGNLLWDGTTSVAVDLTPSVAAGVVYVADQNGILYAFPTACSNPCSALWSTAGRGVIFASPVTVVGPVLYVGGYEGNLYALDARTGSLRWKAKVNDNDPLRTPPAVDASRVYTFGDRGVYAFPRDCSTPCSPVWLAPTPFSSWNSVAVSGGSVFATFGTSLYALDASTGGQRWTAVAPAAVHAPAVGEGFVVTASSDGTVQAFAASGCGHLVCGPLWTFHEVRAMFDPTIANGVVYVGDMVGTYLEGEVLAFDAGCSGSCSPLWTSGVAGAVEWPVAVANGHLLAATMLGNVYSFGLP